MVATSQHSIPRVSQHTHRSNFYGAVSVSLSIEVGLPKLFEGLLFECIGKRLEGNPNQTYGKFCGGVLSFKQAEVVEEEEAKYGFGGRRESEDREGNPPPLVIQKQRLQKTCK